MYHFIWPKELENVSSQKVFFNHPEVGHKTPVFLYYLLKLDINPTAETKKPHPQPPTHPKHPNNPTPKDHWHILFALWKWLGFLNFNFNN